MTSPNIATAMQRSRRRSALLSAATLSLLILATGCSNNSPGDTTPVGFENGSSPSAPSPTQPGEAPAGTIAVREDPKLGPVVTGAEGMTLYRFDKDDPKTAKSACEGQCAETWPPVPAGAQAPAEVDPAALGETQRGDGTKQLTIGGWPVYRYSKDTAPGDTKGQSVSGWAPVAPDGKRAAKPGTQPNGKGGKEQEVANPPGHKGETTHVTVVVQPALGTILVDSRGRTLYGNGGGRTQRTCTGSCRSHWTPVRVREDFKTDKIDRKIVGTLRLEDQTLQLVIKGEPVFVYDGDSASGQINGNGRNGCWWAVNQDGVSVGQGK